MFAQVNQGTASSGYAELHIANDINQDLVLGSIGSTYASSDWAASRYLYSTHGDLLIKSAAELELFSGGNTVVNHRSMVMNANGHITTPRNPAFNVQASASTTLSNSWQIINYDANLTQRGGSNYSTTNKRFTAPVAGYYQFNASFSVADSADVDGTITFWVNGGTPANKGTVSMPDDGGSYDGKMLSACFPLSANDYVDVRRYSTVSTTNRSGGWQGNFSGYLIG